MSPLLISTRRNLRDAIFHSKAPSYMAFGSDGKWSEIARHEFADYVRGKRILIFIHGYNSEYEAALEAYWVLYGRAKDWYDVVVFMVWPGSQLRTGYPAAVWRANKSGSMLATVFSGITPASVTIMTHSLGARVGLSAMSQSYDLKRFSLILTAPAVDNDVLQPGDEFGSFVPFLGSVYVWWSADDPVLKHAFTAGDIFNNTWRLFKSGFKAWDIADKALGLTGPENVDARFPPNCFSLNCTEKVKKHGDYRFTNECYEYWQRIISGQKVNRLEVIETK